MATIPVISTERLVLRPFREDEAAAVQRLLFTPHVAGYTRSVTWPDSPGAA